MSTRDLIKSTLIIGSAQFASIAISIIRVKILAIFLGPAGFGLLGLLTSVRQTAVTFSGLGISASGVRQIASTKDNQREFGKVRRVMFVANLCQGAIAACVVWFLRDKLALWLLGDISRANQVGLIGVSVLFALVASSQTALLQGIRRIGDLGRLTVLGTAAGSIAGVLVVWVKGLDGIIWLILVEPLAAVIVAHHFTKRISLPAVKQFPAREIWRVWRPMASLGMTFMLSAIIATISLLFVRAKITQELGLDAAGHFSASWGITMQYLGFLLGAMSADYYPRLTEVIHDKATSQNLINAQIQIGLALGGPVLLLLVGLAPWAISLLYSPDFQPASEMLQWQTLGNVFRLACWPLGFALIAAGRPWIYFFGELLWNSLYVMLIWFGLPQLELGIVGIGFAMSYLIYLGFLVLALRRLQNFKWARTSRLLLIVHSTLTLCCLALALRAPALGAIVSILLAIATAVIGVRILLVKIGTDGRLATILSKGYGVIGWPLERSDGR